MTKGMTVALIAHDNKKKDLANWVRIHQGTLGPHTLIATATTGQAVKETTTLISLKTVKSGPLGGDQQIGGMIAEGQVDLLIFFTDPMTPHPHDVDVKALTRLATVYDVPMACSQATADLIIASGYLSDPKKSPART